VISQHNVTLTRNHGEPTYPYTRPTTDDRIKALNLLPTDR
jgi:hypothetical protein